MAPGKAWRLPKKMTEREHSVAAAESTAAGSQPAFPLPSAQSVHWARKNGKYLPFYSSSIILMPNKMLPCKKLASQQVSEWMKWLQKKSKSKSMQPASQKDGTHTKKTACLSTFIPGAGAKANRSAINMKFKQQQQQRRQINRRL